jgi:hypothetical protein
MLRRWATQLFLQCVLSRPLLPLLGSGARKLQNSLFLFGAAEPLSVETVRVLGSLTCLIEAIHLTNGKEIKCKLPPVRQDHAFLDISISNSQVSRII